MKNQAQKSISAKEIKENFEKAQTLLRNLTEEKQHYRIVYESFYNNKELNSDEIALLFFLITRSKDYKPSYNGIQRALKIGKKALTKASKGLQEKGYLKIIFKGRFNKEWIITQEPIINTDSLNGIAYEPSRIKEQLEKGIFSKDQAKNHLKKYITNIFYEWRDYLTDEEIQEIIKERWL